MDIGFSTVDWFLAFGMILGVIGMVGLIGSALTLFAVPADHPALKPPSDDVEQLELPLDRHQPAWHEPVTI